MGESRTCREFTQAINDPDSKVNCATCIKWDKETERCADETGVVQRYEDSERFKVYDRMMKSNRGVVIDGQ